MNYKIYCLIPLALFLLPQFSFRKNESIEGVFYRNGEQVSIEIVNGKIGKIHRLPKKEDVPKIYIAPGLIDIQINGYVGVDFSDQNLTTKKLKEATKSLWKVGVTTFLPTVVSNDHAHMKNSFSLLSQALEDKEIAQSIPGFHMEGPYISPERGYRGAHLAKNIRKPDWKEWDEFQSASHNRIKIITVAPEVDGAIPFIAECVQSGVIVSLGHHNGTAEDINNGVDVGASLCTHLGNGCANMINRHLNPLWPQLANDDLAISIIGDGFHLNREEIRSFYKIKGIDKTILISDAVDLAGLPPGEYIRREKKLVLTPENVVKFPTENVLAGAANPISVGVSNVMKFTGCSLAEAIQMASTNPAKLLGLNDLGVIKTGKRANLIMFEIVDDKIVVIKTIVEGKVVYDRELH